MSDPLPDRLERLFAEAIELDAAAQEALLAHLKQTEPIDRIVAIKLLLPGLAAVLRFQRERRTLALLNHPNIASLLEAGQTPTGRPYVVMEFVDGVPLLEHCQRRSLDTEARLHLFLEACDGIVDAHPRAVIHRDLKQTPGLGRRPPVTRRSPLHLLLARRERALAPRSGRALSAKTRRGFPRPAMHDPSGKFRATIPQVGANHSCALVADPVLGPCVRRATTRSSPSRCSVP